MNRKAFFLAIFALLAIVLIGSYFYKDPKDDQPIIADNTADLPRNIVDDLDSTEEDVKDAEGNQAAKKTPPPYIGQPITFLGNDPIINQIPREAVDKHRQLLADLVVTLFDNPDDFDGWMTVAYIKKLFNNYEGARDAWEYAKKLVPNSPVTYMNLGNLYGYYLNDLEKAEGNFSAAIQFDFSNAAGARYNAAVFYRDFGMKEKALQFFKELLQINPNDEAIKEEIRRLEEAN